MTTIFRKWFLKKYLNSIDANFFILFDYEKSSILESINNLRLKKLIRIDDVYFLAKTKLVLKLKLNLIFGNSYIEDFKSSYLS